MGWVKAGTGVAAAERKEVVFAGGVGTGTARGFAWLAEVKTEMGSFLLECMEIE